MGRVRTGNVGRDRLVSAIDRYVAELGARLPVPAHRLLHETRDHLVEARDRYVREGLSHDEAEARAVADMGDVSDLVAAVERDGSPVLSPAVTRWMPRLAFVCVFPALVFLMVNVIEWLAGNDGGIGVFGSSLEGGTGILNGVVGAGPFVALVLILAPAVRVQAVRTEAGFDTRVHVRLSWRQTVLGVVTAVLAVGVAVYLLSENGVVMLPGSWDIW